MVRLAGLVFRRFAIEHPSLFRITFQSNPTPMSTSQSVRDAADAALEVLRGRIARLQKAGLLDGYRVPEATLHFHAVCEGLAGLELRGLIPADAAERVWRHGLGAVVRGLAGPRPERTATRGEPRGRK